MRSDDSDFGPSFLLDPHLKCNESRKENLDVLVGVTVGTTVDGDTVGVLVKLK